MNKKIGHQKHDMSNFTLKDMAECGSILRGMGKGCRSMEEAADKIVRFFYEHMIIKHTDEKAFALVRLFKTHSYEALSEELRAYASNLLEKDTATPQMKCLTLLATAGDRPEWNSRDSSTGHKAIPLPSEDVVNQIPMIRNLIKQLGLAINTVINPDPALLLDLSKRNFSVFHVPEAAGSPFIPAQKDFVIPFGIKSVIGFGGLLSMGDMFTIIAFSKVPISKQTAGMFSSLALNIKLAIMTLEEKVFIQDQKTGGIVQ